MFFNITDLLGSAGANSEPPEKIDYSEEHQEKWKKQKNKKQIMMLIADSVFVFQPIYNRFQHKQIVATLFPAQMFILQFPFSDSI